MQTAQTRQKRGNHREEGDEPSRKTKQKKKRGRGEERRNEEICEEQARMHAAHTQKKDEKVQRDEDRGIKIGGWVCRGRRRATLVSAAVG